ncbi:MAG: hypothetical protein LBD24_01835 [Spirochaetaceae bacterium]|jgi:hypothetical protein|nr:hypothetical protein [Spirochaetaceae bacterium]
MEKLKNIRTDRLAVLGIALIFIAMTAVVAFAEEEYEWKIEVAYKEYKVVQGKKTKDFTVKYVTYTLWAPSSAEAERKAAERCTYEKGEAVSCGAAIATGMKRGS